MEEATGSSTRITAAAGEPRSLELIEGGLHAEYIVAQDPELLVPRVRRFFEETLGRSAELEAGGRAPGASPEITWRRDKS